MKIQLERTLTTCPPSLMCIACRELFEVNRIRTLLCSDEGLIHGDICPACLKLEATGINQKFKEQAMYLLHQSEDNYNTGKYNRSPQLQVSTAEIKLPKFYQWWLKELEILSQETQELEKARRGISDCRCNRQRSRLRSLFEKNA